MQELLESGYLVEVHKFSKFIHGTATLFPDMVRVPPNLSPRTAPRGGRAPLPLRPRPPALP